jgi:hypothetical protein
MNLVLTPTKPFQGKCNCCKKERLLTYRNEKAKGYCKKCSLKIYIPERLIAIEEKPVAVAEKPIAIEEKPVAVAEKPVAEKPVAVAEKPQIKYHKRLNKKPKATSTELLILKIEEYLKAEYLTVSQIFSKLEEYTSSFQRVYALISFMRSRNIIDGEYLGRHTEKTYFLTSDRSKFQEQANAYFLEDVVSLLDDEPILIQDLIKKLNRPRATVASWLEKLEKSGEINLEVLPVKGKRGTYKFVSRKNSTVTQPVG